jgi:hypothetical protein
MLCRNFWEVFLVAISLRVSSAVESEQIQTHLLSSTRVWRIDGGLTARMGFTFDTRLETSRDIYSRRMVSLPLGIILGQCAL